MSPITIHPLPYTHPDATALRAAQQLEVSTLRPTGFGIPATAANVPIFPVAYDEDQPIGCGGLRPLAEQGLPGQAEVKRMYVVPERRGRSEGGDGGVVVAELVLKALEEVARKNGWLVLRAQASKAMGQAMRFYEKHGFVRCEIFGSYKVNEWFVYYEKRLG
jgi:GNAT superfamily N-acetyltransferase